MTWIVVYREGCHLVMRFPVRLTDRRAVAALQSKDHIASRSGTVIKHSILLSDMTYYIACHSIPLFDMTC